MSCSSHFSAGEETQILPLHQFAPGAPASSTEGMTMFIKRAAEETLQDGAIVLPKNTGAMPPETLLGAVTYCYASDVYESERIEKKFVTNPELKSAIGPELPPASAIRRFRKLNRSTILNILEKALVLQKRKEKETNTGDETIFLARSQAEQKLQLASLLDAPH
jgi:hypothetical protein